MLYGMLCPLLLHDMPHRIITHLIPSLHIFDTNIPPMTQYVDGVQPPNSSSYLINHFHLLV